MLFEVVNPTCGRRTHCGVMEFSAEEGVCYLPYWMMQNLLLQAGSMCTIFNCSLKKGTYVKLQPHEYKFTQLSNPRAVLEHALRGFSCLTKGDAIAINFGDKLFYLDVVEVKPGTAVSIIETDVNVDFAPPKDMKEVEERMAREKEEKEREELAKPSASDIPVPEETTDSKLSSPASPGKGGRTSKALADAEKRANYFANLGGGYSLKRSKSKSSSSSPAPPASTSSSSSNSSPQSPSLAVDNSKSTKFDYQYQIDKKGRKKLVKRSNKGKRPNPFAGKGHSLK